MYYEYFGFTQPPFKITPDTRLFYSGGDRGAILDALLYAILNGEGIVKVVGEVGSGKTMLCRMLEKELHENVEVVYLVNPSISPENTLHAIAFELKLDVRPDTSRFEVMNQLQGYLLQRHSENRQVVVFVEEAQSMPIATLEEIRLLSNLETQQSKLLQIVLFGQPELDEMIARPEIRQLKERITYSFQLSPFRTNDIREYINTRVRACGYRAGELFDDAAIRQIERYSKGLLRRINILADKALLAAFAQNTHKVSAKHTRLAARDSEFISPSPRLTRPLIMVTGAALMVLILAGGYYFFVRTAIQPIPAVDVTLQPESPATELQAPSRQALHAGAGSESLGESVLDHDGDELSGQQDQPEIEEEQLVVQEIAEDVPGIAELAMTPTAETVVAENTSAIQEPVNPPPSSGNISEEAGSGSRSQAVAEQELSENQLPGMSSGYPFLDFSDSSLTEEEAAQLGQQLTNLPPESSEYKSLEDDTCEQCWSIIYRPVWRTEKL